MSPALHSTGHNHSLSSDTSDNLGLRGDNKRSAMQVTLYLTIDFHQAFCGDIADNLQTIANDCSTTPRYEHRFLL
jgi:hypothetical protein